VPIPSAPEAPLPEVPVISSATAGQRLAAPAAAVQPVQIAVSPMHSRVRQPATKLFPWGGSELDVYETEAACPFAPTADNSISDAQGRLWGKHSGRECVFKAATGTGRSAAAKAGITWQSAAVCKAASATNANSVLDADGKLWGWENGRSCAHRNAAGSGSSGSSSKGGSKSSASAAAVRSVQPHSSDRMTVVWEAAPACSSVPTAANTIADKFGRLWSWEDGTTCAFKVR
jgi:hypothetical protein